MSALQHHLSTTTGCSTNQTSPTGAKEVHVISVGGRRGGYSRGRTHNAAGHRLRSRRSDTMTLHIEPRDSGLIPTDHAVVVVLRTPQPVVWSISTTNINNSSRYLFVVSTLCVVISYQNFAKKKLKKIVMQKCYCNTMNICMYSIKMSMFMFKMFILLFYV